jgi:N-acetyl-gamma-glutamyl-phosphate reductase
VDVISLPVEKADAKAVAQACELVFLALPHKASMGFAKALLALGVKVVDLSADYRLELDTYEAHYCPHEDKAHLSSAVYALVEYYR